MHPSCGKCIVEIQEPWYNKMEMHDAEDLIIRANPCNIPVGDFRRLACAITVEPWMNEMVVSCPVDSKSFDPDDYQRF